VTNLVKFYLGTHEPSWLEHKKDKIPFFISRRRLIRRKKLPIANYNWALDSGGFTELNQIGNWSITAKEYKNEVIKYINEIGKMDFASSQDWMCEPFVLKKTKLTVKEHQKRTVENYIELMNLDSSIPWLPVIQGFELTEYLQCIELYNKYNIDLTKCKLVGLGSVCRRQGTLEAANIVKTIDKLNINLHGFGFKIQGFKLCKQNLVSADSMAWSLNARRDKRLPGCTNHIKCSNCYEYAKLYYYKVQDLINL
jgi:hypothetical protein